MSDTYSPKLADEETVRNRRLICDNCEHKSVIGLCVKCGCIVFLKTTRAKKKCPMGKW